MILKCWSVPDLNPLYLKKKQPPLKDLEKSLSEKILLVTGGNSQLGQAIVRKALAQEAQVFFTYFQHEEEARPLLDLGAEGFRINLADMREIDQLVKSLKEKISCLDILIHNAACVRDHSLQNISEEDWDQVLTVNLKAPYYLTKKAMPLLFKSESAKIFMIISRLAVTGGFGVSNYAAAKGGLIGLTKSLAAELGKKKIAVNAINPGFMRSRMTEHLPEEVIRKNL